MKISNAISGQNYALDALRSGDCAAVLSPTAGHLFWQQHFWPFSASKTILTCASGLVTKPKKPTSVSPS